MKNKSLTLRTDPVTKLLLALVAAGLWWHALRPFTLSTAHADGVTQVDVISVGGQKLNLVSQQDIMSAQPDSNQRAGLPVCNVNTR